jgi:hypothetical protein
MLPALLLPAGAWEVLALLLLLALLLQGACLRQQPAVKQRQQEHHAATGWVWGQAHMKTLHGKYMLAFKQAYLSAA